MHFVVQAENRDNLKRFLLKKNIQTPIHYPIPIHLQPATKRLSYNFKNLKMTEKQAKKIITLPINQFISVKEIKLISELINYFYEKKF